VEQAADGRQMVGHSKAYVQVWATGRCPSISSLQAEARRAAHRPRSARPGCVVTAWAACAHAGAAGASARARAGGAGAGADHGGHTVRVPAAACMPICLHCTWRDSSCCHECAGGQWKRSCCTSIPYHPSYSWHRSLPGGSRKRAAAQPQPMSSAVGPPTQAVGPLSLSVLTPAAAPRVLAGLAQRSAAAQRLCPQPS
jgi:hypothetical protein